MAINLTQGMVFTLPSLPADLDVSYTPDVLLEVPFQAWVTAHTDFKRACFHGFETFFEELIDEDEDGQEVFVKHGYSWDEIVEYLVEGVSVDYPPLPASLHWKAGFWLSWLSALAFLDADEAQRGLVVLLALLGPAALSDERKKPSHG